MDAVFLKIVNMSLTAGWLVLAVILLRFVFKKAPKWLMCVLWAFVGLKLVFPFSVESALSLIPSSEPLPSDILITDTPSINSGFDSINQAVNPVIQDYLSPEIGASVNPMQVLCFICAIVWLVGIAAMLIYTLASYLRIKGRVSEAVILKENIYLCDRIDSPFILGLINPKIYLPSSITQSDVDFVVAHEKAHLKRKDHLWKPLGFLLLSVYWFNPLMWVAYILLCRDIELACDEKVIKNMGTDIKKEYSTALINCSISRKSVAACPLAFGETGIKERVKSVLSYKKPAFWVIIISVAAIAVTAICLLTSPEKDSPKAIEYGAKYTDFEGVNIEVIQVETDAQRTVLSAQWQNLTPYEITYGNSYTVERKESKKWVSCQIPEEFIVNAIAYSQKPNTMQDKIYNLTDTFDISETGTYRIRANCYVQTEEAPTKCEVWAEFVVTEADLESFVAEQILEINGRPYEADNYPGVAFEILGTEKNDKQIKLYMWVMYQEYSFKGGDLVEENGFNGPRAITVEETENGYKLVRYWEPGLGTDYIRDIKAEFPSLLQFAATNSAYNTHIVNKLRQITVEKAQAHFQTEKEPFAHTVQEVTTTIIEGEL